MKTAHDSIYLISSIYISSTCMALSSIAGDRWNTYHVYFGDHNEYVALTSFREDVMDPARQTEHQMHRRIVCTAKNTMPNLLPTKEEHEQLQQYEDALLQRLDQASVDAWFVGRLTYAAKREWVFQVNDADAFDAVAQEFLESITDHEYEYVKESGWGYVHENVTPQPEHWAQIMDRGVIDQLVQAGANPQKPHMLDHGFKGADASLDAVQAELEKEGFSQTQREADVLTMSRQQQLHLDEVNSVTVWLLQVAHAHGVEYMGWGAQIVE